MKVELDTVLFERGAHSAIIKYKDYLSGSVRPSGINTTFIADAIAEVFDVDVAIINIALTEVESQCYEHMLEDPDAEQYDDIDLMDSVQHLIDNLDLDA